MSKYTDLFNIYCDFIAKYDPYYIIDGRPNPADMLYNMYEIRNDFINDDPGLLQELNYTIDQFENIMQKFSINYLKFFINHEILPQLDNSIKWADIMPAKDLIKLLRDFRHDQIKQGGATKRDIWTAKVNDGFLYINDIPVGRTGAAVSRSYKSNKSNECSLTDCIKIYHHKNHNQKYERKTTTWERRGGIRHLKSGKVVPYAASTCHARNIPENSTNTANKSYRL